MNNHIANKSIAYLILFLIFTGAPSDSFSADIDAQNTYNPSDKKPENINHWKQFNLTHKNKWKIIWNKKTGTPHRISGHNLTLPESATEKNIQKLATQILHKYQTLLQIDNHQLKFKNSSHIAAKNKQQKGTWHVTFQQHVNNIPVSGGSVRLAIQDNKLLSLSSDFYPGIKQHIQAALIDSEAKTFTCNAFESDYKKTCPEIAQATQMIEPVIQNNVIHYLPSWHITLSTTRLQKRLIAPENGDNRDEIVPVQFLYIIDATTGDIIKKPI